MGNIYFSISFFHYLSIQLKAFPHIIKVRNTILFLVTLKSLIILGIMFQKIVIVRSITVNNHSESNTEARTLKYTTILFLECAGKKISCILLKNSIIKKTITTF